MNLSANGCNTHIVIKIEDVTKYLTNGEQQSLDMMLSSIKNGRNRDRKRPVNSYYVCNTDEPYAEAVRNAIINGEEAKLSQNRNTPITEEKR